MPLAPFDLETTGVDPTSARVVTGYLGRIAGAEVRSRSWLLDPGIEIPTDAAKIHGITTEVAREKGSDYREGLFEIWSGLGSLWKSGHIVAAYNGAYDLTVIDSECRRLGIGQLAPGPMVDPFVLDAHLDPDRVGSRKLAATVAAYGLRMGSAHTADADALAAARLAWVIPRRYPEIADLTVEELMRFQPLWYARRADDLAKRFASVAQSKRERASSLLAEADELDGRVSGINRRWPIQ